MSALSAINYLFLNQNFGAVPAGEPFHNCIIIPVSSGSFTDSFAKVHIFIDNPSCNFFKKTKTTPKSLVMLSLPIIFAKKCIKQRDCYNDFPISEVNLLTLQLYWVYNIYAYIRKSL